MKTIRELFESIAAHIVVEQGTSGGWTYRKYADGTAECWGGVSASTTLATVGSYYHRGTLTFSFPSGLFNTSPVLNVLCQQGFWCGINSVSKSSATLYAFDVVNGTTNLGLHVHAIGRWK